ncbi:MAG TPA: DciA family protein [Candidatus Saccharimonadales bacterium]|nr:DciA family protein [Candidatus Saccharimonadales bacterium]
MAGGSPSWSAKLLESTGDYLKKRAAALGLVRGDALVAAQSLLDALYPAQTRAISLNEGALKVITANASVAQDLRLRQVELITKLNQQLPRQHYITKLHIQIRAL